MTRSSATADGPRDALCQSESCKLLHNCRNQLYNKSITNRGPVWNKVSDGSWKYPNFRRYPNFLVTQRMKLPCQNQLDSFSRFDRTPTGEKQKQMDTDRHRVMAYRPIYCASIASRGKTTQTYELYMGVIHGNFCFVVYLNLSTYRIVSSLWARKISLSRAYAFACHYTTQ